MSAEPLLAGTYEGHSANLGQLLRQYEGEMMVCAELLEMSRDERRKSGCRLNYKSIERRQGELADLAGGVRDAMNGENT